MPHPLGRPLGRVFAIAVCMAPFAPGSGYAEPFEVSLAPAKLEMHVSELIPQSVYIVPTPEAHRQPSWDSLWVRLEVPAGFRIPSGSLVLGADTLLASGGTGEIEAALPALGPDSTYCLRYLLGSNRKTAQGRFAVGARIRRGSEWLSARAEGTIEVLDAPLYHRSILVGCVFRDLDGDGAQREGEPGIAGARVLTREGPEAWTDERGEFTIEVPHGGRLLAELETPGDTDELLVLGGRHRLVSLVPGVPQRVAYPVVSRGGRASGGTGFGADPAGPCASLAAWDRRLWGGFFVLDRDDDRRRLDLARACATADTRPAFASVATTATTTAMPAPSRTAAAQEDPTRSRPPASGAPRPASAPSRAARFISSAIAKFRTGVLRAVEEPEPAALKSAPELARAASSGNRDVAVSADGTIEIGERMFLPGTARLTGEYASMFEALGRTLARQNLTVKLRSAGALRRDEAVDPAVDRRRLAAVETALDRGRASAYEAPGSPGASGASREESHPREALLEARIEEDLQELRLVLTFSGRVEYAWGTRPAADGDRATLCLLSAGLSEEFVMPYLPRKSPLRGLVMDADAGTGSVLIHVEPAPGLRPYLETLGDPFRLVVRIARSTEPAR